MLRLQLHKFLLDFDTAASDLVMHLGGIRTDPDR